MSKGNKPTYPEDKIINLEEISVNCYSGFRLNEKPMKFKYRGNEFLIKKILDSSIKESPEGRMRRYCFKVLCETDEKFEIFFDPREDQWFLRTP